MKRRTKNGMMVFFALLALGLGITVFHYIRFQYFSLSMAEKEMIVSDPSIALGHGGMGNRSLLYAMDTYPSVKQCFHHGAKGIEIDVQLTKDGKLILYHDKHLPGPKEDKNTVRNRNWEGDLEQLKVPARLFNKEEILTLDSFLQLTVLFPGAVIFIEHKMYASGDERIDQESIEAYSKQLIPFLQTYQHTFQLVVESKYIELLKALQSSKTSAQLFLNSSSFENGLKQATENGLSGISIYFDRIKAAQIGIAKEQSLLISVFGVNTWSKNKESILMSADYIQSDRIRHLVKIMEDLYE